MTPDRLAKLKRYEQWRSELIDVAIREFDYSHDVIEPLASGHLYQDYFEDGDTPRQAMQAAESHGF